MNKNQLQELAQRSCFNLPSYTSIREGPDHAPRFKAIVNFNGDTFESPNFCSTLRLSEHSAAEAALISLSSRGASHALAARILDETGVYKNLLQEIAQRAGSPLPRYTTFRSGSGNPPVFRGTVELSGITFTGEPAKSKKQAEKNAALAAWSSLKLLEQKEATSSQSEHESNEEQEQIRIARALQSYHLKEKLAMQLQPNLHDASIPFVTGRVASAAREFRAHDTIHRKFLGPTPRPITPTSKKNPFFSHKSASPNCAPPLRQHIQRYRAVEAAPYISVRQCMKKPYHGVAPPVNIRNAVPVFSALPPQFRPQPVCIRQVVPAFTAASSSTLKSGCDVDESIAVRCMEQPEI